MTGPVTLLRYLLGAYDQVVDMHALVRMDTPEDRDLHDRGLHAFREAAEPVRAYLAELDSHRAVVPPPRSTQ